MQPELCFDLLQGSCPFFFFFWIPFSYVASSVTNICRVKYCHLVILLFDLNQSYTHLRDLVMFYGFVSNLHPLRRNLVT